jgi:hypothetical protein
MPFSLDNLSPKHRAEAEAQLGKKTALPWPLHSDPYKAISAPLPAKKKRVGVQVAPGVGEGLKTQGRAASDDFNAPPDHHSPLPHPEPQPHQAPALGGADGREEAGIPRIVVRFTGFRVRPLDPDNFAGSVKDLLDGLRHAGLLLGDEPWRIRLETEQVRVGTYAEEKTVIDLIFP